MLKPSRYVDEAGACLERQLGRAHNIDASNLKAYSSQSSFLAWSEGGSLVLRCHYGYMIMVDLFVIGLVFQWQPSLNSFLRKYCQSLGINPAPHLAYPDACQHITAWVESISTEGSICRCKLKQYYNISIGTDYHIESILIYSCTQQAVDLQSQNVQT
jgi:hypothetical protein